MTDTSSNFPVTNICVSFDVLFEHLQARLGVNFLQPLRAEIGVMSRKDRPRNPAAERIHVSVRNAQLAHLGAEPVPEHLRGYVDAGLLPRTLRALAAPLAGTCQFEVLTSLGRILTCGTLNLSKKSVIPFSSLADTKKAPGMMSRWGVPG